MVCMYICVLQDYDMMLLCWSPEIFSIDVAPPALHTVFYRQHPEENEDIGHFIYEVRIECLCVYVRKSHHDFCKFNILVGPGTVEKKISRNTSTTESPSSWVKCMCNILDSVSVESVHSRWWPLCGAVWLHAGVCSWGWGVWSWISQLSTVHQRWRSGLPASAELGTSVQETGWYVCCRKRWVICPRCLCMYV